MSWLHRLLIALGPTTVLLAHSAVAQPEVMLEFVDMFGQKKPYIRCRQDQLINGICTLPPNQNPPEGFISPTGIDWLDAGRLVIADRGNLKLQVCGADGVGCVWVGGDGAGGGQFSGRNFAGVFDLPHGVDVDPLGRIAVADEDNQLLQYCDETGGCTVSGDTSNTNAGCQSGLGRWCEPHDAAFDSTGRIFALDTGNNRIQVLVAEDNASGNPQLNLRRVLGRSGSAPGEFDGPGGIAIDADDTIIVADTNNHRIQVCRPASATNLDCETFGRQGSALGQFDTPTGVDVDGQGRIWIADTNNHRIQVCDRSGDCVAFGSFGDFDPFSDDAEGGSDEGPMRFNQPHDVAVHPGGQVVVVDTANHRIQRFQTESSFSINAGMNDAWVNLDTLGQGLFFTAWPGLGESGLLSVAHFTFDAQPVDPEAGSVVGGANQRWVTAIGDVNGATAVLTAQLTSGGIFDSSDPQPMQEPAYGTYTIVFHDCMTATLTYDFPTLGLSGTIELVRAVPDNAALCEVLQGP